MNEEEINLIVNRVVQRLRVIGPGLIGERITSLETEPKIFIDLQTNKVVIRHKNKEIELRKVDGKLPSLTA